MPRTRPWTYDDYAQLDDDRRYEVIGGQLLLMPAPRLRHQEVALELAVRLRGFVKEREVGKVYVSPIDVVLSETDVVQPDVVFVAADRLGVLRDTHVRGAPDLLVEVLSPSGGHRDRVLKQNLYARSGVREYWIVDPDGGPAVEVRGLGEGGAWTLLGCFGPGEAVTSRVLSGLTLDPGELLEG